MGNGDGHVQSLILTAILLVTSLVLFIAGVLADLSAVNRALLEEIRTRLRDAELNSVSGQEGESFLKSSGIDKGVVVVNSEDK